MKMPRSRLVAATILFFLIISPVFSQEPVTEENDNGFETVTGLESWRHEIDISEYPAGKYNIIIEGRDKAGNSYIEGPFDIYIDPDSDKPVVNISNPEPQMKVNGNLNIIGTCVDDDSVSGVEIKVDEGSFKRAEGAEFWSFYLETAGLEDGVHLLSARGIDENGTIGDEQLTEFILDRSVPDTEISSIANGAIVNGKIVLEGKTFDLNGIEKLELSTDDGETFSRVSIKKVKKEFYAEFRIKVDTRELEDGPHIYWLRSTDGTGSAGLFSFLFFIDNRPPELELLYPAEDDAVNGKFRVAGWASDDVGAELLTYRTGGGDPVEIPLSVGDPYWYQDFDFTGEKKADITFELTDRTGNTTERRLQMLLDAEGDKPAVELISPELSGVYEKVEISGFITDDDGAAEIVYSIDGGEEIRLPAEYSFNIEPEEQVPGEHSIKIFAVDSAGTTGDPMQTGFIVVSGEPEIELNTLIPSEGDTLLDFKQAAEINLEEYKSLEGLVHFYNEPEAAFLSVDGAEEIKLGLKKDDDTLKRLFSVPLKEIADGYHYFRIRAEDKAGLTGEQTFFLMVRDPAAPAGTRQMYSADSRFSDSGKPGPGLFRLSEKEQIAFFLDGDSPDKTTVSGDAAFIKVSEKGSYVIIEAVSPGFAENVSVEISTKSGKTHKIGPFDIGVDDESPQLKLNKTPDGTLVAGSAEMAGEVSDNLGLESLEYSVNGGEFIRLETADGEFQYKIDLDNEADGGTIVELRATDRLENVTVKRLYFRNDTTPPKLNQIAPSPAVSANGVVKFIGRIDDESRIATVEYSSDGENFSMLDNSVFPTGTINLTAGENDAVKHVFRITDAAGNSSETEPEIRIAVEDDTPKIEIQTPDDGTLVRDDFVISGMAFDDDQINSLQYRIDDSDFTEIAPGNNFEIPVSISDISDNGHTIEVKAADPNGVESEVDSLNIYVSKAEPQTLIDSPDLDSTVGGVVTVSGSSADENGISRVLISYDNGNTFNTAEIAPAEQAAAAKAEQGSENNEEKPEDTPETGLDEDPLSKVRREVSWNYKLDTGFLQDGSHSLLIKAVDEYGVEGLYTTLINIDNTPPVIEITEPREGADTADVLMLKGRVEDNIELAEVKVELQHLSEPEKTLTRTLPLDEIMLQELDFSEFPSGWINIRLSAADKTGNSVSVSRNIVKHESLDNRKVVVLSPSKGAFVNGDLTVQGKAADFSGIKSAELLMDGKPACAVEINDSGYFHALLDNNAVLDGSHSISVVVEDADGARISSDEVSVEYSALGPWIKIGNFSAGDFATDRPWITGTAGYTYIEPELEEKELEKFRKSREVEVVDVSLDNGKTFMRADGREEWKFRLETQNLGMGNLWVLIRGRFRDGTTAVSKTLLIVDETPPRVELLAPGEGMRFNDTINLIGIADDEYGLYEISAALREGGKSSYEVPSFIQGLYIDTHFLGATYAELGLGLTFFDDNVKLQAIAGMAPPGRFSGITFGLKLLANIAVLPWEYFFGYDFRNFSSSVAVGTTFEYFSMPDEEGSLFGEEGIVLGALIGQAELVKFSIPDLKMFSSYSFYAELQMWFISSDVDAGTETRLSFGLRADVF